MRHPSLLSSLSSLLLLLAAALPCLAQQKGARVTLQFVSFPRITNPETIELLLPEGKTLSISIPSNELSPPYKVPASAHWAVGNMEEGKDGKPKFKVYGKIKALSAPKQLLLLVRKGPTNADGFNILAFDNRSNKFGGGTFLFLNASHFDIAGEVGGKKFTLKPGAHNIIAPKPDAGKQLCHTTLYYRSGKETKPFFDSNWPLRKDARGLIFFYTDPKSQRLKFHTIRDFL